MIRRGDRLIACTCEQFRFYADEFFSSVGGEHPTDDALDPRWIAPSVNCVPFGEGSPRTLRSSSPLARYITTLAESERHRETGTVPSAFLLFASHFFFCFVRTHGSQTLQLTFFVSASTLRWVPAFSVAQARFLFKLAELLFEDRQMI